MPKDEQLHKSKIGGQALIEGIMMRGVHQSAMAVRLPDQSIDLEVWPTQKEKDPFRSLKKVPFVRGIFNMIDSLVVGYRCMMKSAEKAGLDEEEEPSRFEQWLQEKFGDALMKGLMVVSGVLGVVLALVLFLFLPTLVVWALGLVLPVAPVKSLLEGIIKMAIFLTYLALIGKMPEIRRTFEYHGAEHKTIACFEAGEELTVENIKKQTRFHPRCGTSFLFLVLLIGILLFSVVTVSNPLLRTALRIVLLPVMVGITYELIRLAGRYDNVCTRIISWPGLRIQRLTTREPDDSQIEVALAAFRPCIPENLEEDRW